MMSPETPSLRPLSLSDSQILELVYQYCTVVNNKDGQNFNVDVLFSVVSDVMRPSVGAAAAPLPPLSSMKTEEECKAAKIEPPIQTLKHIACQMMQTAEDENHSYAHETTMSILEQLKAYSWDAKAVIALAAFSLEYGNFWHLSQVPREDDLGRSLALLNNVQVELESPSNFHKNKNNNVVGANNNISEYNLLVKNIFEAVKSIVELETMVKQVQGYEQKDDVPTFMEAIHDFPVFVYWVILAIVACALHINFLTNYWDREGKYELFNISSKISNVHSKLRALLGMIRKEIAQKEDYLRNDREAQIPIEIAEVFLEDSDNDSCQ